MALNPYRFEQVATHAVRAAKRSGTLDRLLERVKPTDFCKSPIEELLGIGLAALDANIDLDVQVVVGPYRLDFVLTYGAAVLGVEADGHDFHERTREQATRDKARDRYLLAAGYPVARFTGSEVYADPFKAAEDALVAVRALAERMAS